MRSRKDPSAGDDVIVTGRDAGALAEVVQHTGARGLTCDATRPADIAALRATSVPTWTS
ncbi:MAG: hypothetical protein M3070_01465 [Actinomycetota bacterium]|nr:hypothetical protein [Actinomycetota bacterium]